MKFRCSVEEFIDALAIVGAADVSTGRPPTITIKAETGRVNLWTWGDEVSAMAKTIFRVDEPGVVLVGRKPLQEWAKAVQPLRHEDLTVTSEMEGLQLVIGNARSRTLIRSVLGEIVPFGQPEGEPVAAPSELWAGAWKVAFAAARSNNGSDVGRITNAIHVGDGAVWATDGYRMAVQDLPADQPSTQLMLPVNAGRLNAIMRDTALLKATKDGRGRLHLWTPSLHVIATTIVPPATGYPSWRQLSNKTWDSPTCQFTMARKELAKAVRGLEVLGGSADDCFLDIDADPIMGNLLLGVGTLGGPIASWTVDAEVGEEIQMRVNPHYFREMVGELSEDADGTITIKVLKAHPGSLLHEEGAFRTMMLPMKRSSSSAAA